MTCTQLQRIIRPISKLSIMSMPTMRRDQILALRSTITTKVMRPSTLMIPPSTVIMIPTPVTTSPIRVVSAVSIPEDSIITIPILPTTRISPSVRRLGRPIRIARGGTIPTFTTGPRLPGPPVGGLPVTLSTRTSLLGTVPGGTAVGATPGPGVEAGTTAGVAVGTTAGTVVGAAAGIPVGAAALPPSAAAGAAGVAPILVVAITPIARPVGSVGMVAGAVASPLLEPRPRQYSVPAIALRA